MGKGARYHAEENHRADKMIENLFKIFESK
jgi:hypothetical protein